MKKVFAVGMSLLTVLSLSACNANLAEGSATLSTTTQSSTMSITTTSITTQNSTSSTKTQESTSSIKTNDSVWYSEEEGVRGRLWLGMTEKEVYDVLIKYDVKIRTDFPSKKYDKYGAEYNSPDMYYPKKFVTEQNQFFYFDKNDQLCEIKYLKPRIYGTFESQRGVKPKDTYEDMLNAYGKPDLYATSAYINKSHIYYLENGEYLHFVYQNTTNAPILSVHYSKYPYLFSY